MPVTRYMMRSALLLAALSLAAAACGGDDDGFGFGESTTAAPTVTTTPGTTAPDTTVSAGERYSEETRRSYLEGCTEDAPLAACECTLDEFERRYSESEFIVLALENADATEPPAEVLEVIIACIGDLDDGSGTFPAEFRDGYIEGCAAEGTVEFCTCTLDRFEEIYTLEEFTTVFTEMESDGTMPAEVEAILTECIAASG
jgi:hypothetical protein